ncbi:MAG: hypothetical protein WBA57_26595 [Elainellaceae cyanobacterium]
MAQQFIEHSFYRHELCGDRLTIDRISVMLISHNDMIKSLTTMPERAHLYLGNTLDATDSAALVQADLVQQVAHARQYHDCLDVYLTLEDNRKGRIHAQATSGESVGIIKDREQQLRQGDIFQTESGRLVLIHLQEQPVLVIQADSDAHASALALIHLGHTLGNHHYRIAIRDDRIYVQLEDNADVVEATIRSHNIPGLSVTYEQRVAEQAIAFDSSAHGHAHATEIDSPSSPGSDSSHPSDTAHSHSAHPHTAHPQSTYS